MKRNMAGKVLALGLILLMVSGICMAESAPITLKVGITGNSIKASMVVLAKQMGYYDELGLDVQFENIPSLNEGVVAVDMGKLDVVPMGVIPTMTFFAQGAELVIFGGTIAEGSEAVTLPENKDMIATLTDFSGKKVACVRPETGHMIMKDLIAQAGVGVGTDVEFIELDGFQSVVEAVLKGEADIGFVNSGFGINAVEQGLDVAFKVGQYAPNAVCCRQTTSKAAIENKRDALVKFQMANLRAMKLMRDDPDTTVKILAEFSGQPEQYVHEITYNGVMIVAMDPAKNRVIDFYEAMKRNGNIEAATAYDPENLVDSTIYYDALMQMMETYPDDELFKELMESYQADNN